MSPPDTNLKTQKRRHKGPLIGIALVTIFALGLIFYWLEEEVATAPTTDDTEQTTETVPADTADDGNVVVPDEAPTENTQPAPTDQDN